MGLYWFLSVLFCLLCNWLYTNGDDILKIDGIKLLDPVIKKNLVAGTVVTWFAAASENNTNNTTAVTLRPSVQYATSSAPVAQITQMVPVQTSARQVSLILTTGRQLKQERRGMQASNEFAAHSLPLQRDNKRNNDDFNKKEKLSVTPRSITVKMGIKTAFAGVSEFDEAEDTHFLYYIVVFGAIIVCFIIEGRRPSNNTRRTALRYRRLSHHDDNGSYPTNVIY
ncbi:unnamed protein product [Cercopithifilaria johnstoni]|uniref:Uncharacterized protein n=1 Tax=Cercopithifilaria johnstoni TaxID=2874296 RepID=A0A8J2M0F3_9BILA|nr:unnamed protein product [Cercopithifilaria johnstoni]